MSFFDFIYRCPFFQFIQIIYFCCFTAFVKQQNELRQYAAMNIFLFAFYYLYKKNFLKYLLLVLFAGTFHRSTLLLIVVYLLRSLFMRYSKKNLGTFSFFPA
ncbi:EpsG family protein [Treponema sp.]|uniref:EpsG family protein n=1 Tax=Treponema sp. TaxID=166 RepID=UPI00338F44F1